MNKLDSAQPPVFNRLAQSLLIIKQALKNQTKNSRLPIPAQYGLVAFLLALYLPAIIFLYPTFGESITVLASLPVAAMAWFFRRKTAFLFSICIAAITLLINRIFLFRGNPLMQTADALFSLMVMLILSVIAGWASEMQARMQHELAERKKIEATLIETNAALLESEQRYRMLFNETNEGIVIHDMEGHFLKVNQTAVQQTGYSEDELQTMRINDLDPTGNSDENSAMIQYLREKGQVLFESVVTRRDGSSIPVEVNDRLIEYQGKPAVLSVKRDISQRREMEKSEREQRVLAEALRDILANLNSTLHLEEVLDRVLNNLEKVIEFDAVTIMLLDGPWVRVMRQRGYTEHGLAIPLQDLIYAYDDLYNLRWMNKYKKPLIVANTDQDPHWVDYPMTAWVKSYAGAPINIQGQTIGFLNIDSAQPGFYRPIHSDRLQAFADYAATAIQNARLYAEVQHLAVLDPLTGLYNRRGLSEMGQREVQRAKRFNRPLAAVMLDIDHFKKFNDQYSYTVGDEVLATLASRLKSAVRKDDLVCRYGGDEFVILMAENNLASATVVAEHVRKSVESLTFETSQGPIQVTVSIGVTAQDDDILDLDTLVEKAGELLHTAKQEGRNQIATSETI